jgi:hypothetical protein
MTLLKFNSKNLVRFEADKDASSVYVILYYSDLDNPITLRETIDTSKIFYRSFNQVGNLGWVTFYELSEVYGISDAEKKSLFTKSKVKDKEEIKKDQIINLSEIDNSSDYQDDEFDNLFKDL